MINSNQGFKRHNIFKRIYGKIYVAYRHLCYPESIWYGGSISRETALHSVGAGWAKLINNLYDAKPKHVKVWQVKEKFAGLRFYLDSAPEWYYDLISYYENKSYKICEQCGEKGKVRDGLGWILTLCDKHYQETINQRNMKR